MTQTPTSEERANLLVGKIVTWVDIRDNELVLDLSKATADIAAAIREAVEAETAKWAKGAKIQIPTETMESEFSFHHKQGVKAGRDAEREACGFACAAIEKKLRENGNPDTAAGAAQCFAAIRTRNAASVES